MTELFAEASRSSRSYVVLRNYEKLPEVNVGADIDILVAASDVSWFVGRIASDGRLKITGLQERQYVTTVFVSGLSDVACHSLQIDLVTDFAWKGFTYLDPDAVLRDHARHPKGFNIPQPWHEAVVSLFSSYLIGGWIKDRYQNQVIQAFRTHRTEVVDTLASSLGQQLATRLADVVSSNGKSELSRMLPLIKRSLMLHSLRWGTWKLPGRVFRHWTSEIRIRMTPASLVEVCILGVDGAGKGTIIQHLLNGLGARVKDIEVIHLKPFTKSKESNQVSLPHGLPPRNALLSFGKLSMWLLKYWIHQFRHGHRHLTLVLWDRRIDDAMIDPVRYRIGLPGKFIRLLAAAAPKPDAYLVLDLPAEVAFERKKEIELESLKGLRAKYLEQPWSWAAASTFVVRTDVPVEESGQKALDAINQVLNGRARSLIERRFPTSVQSAVNDR